MKNIFVIFSLILILNITTLAQSDEWIDPVSAGHTAVTAWSNGNGDNSYFGPVNIGFTIPFFTRLYDEIFINTNGYLSFEEDLDETADQATIPYPVSPNNIVAACAMDLNVDNTLHPDANVYYGGTSSQFVVTYIHAYYNGSSTDYITFQIILHPNGNIKFQYNNLLSVEPVHPSIQVLPFEFKESGLVSEFKLEQNYPNPFNASTIISYQLPPPDGRAGIESWVTLKIHNLLGQEVGTLINEYKPAGSYEVEFNPAISIKYPASGIYFCRLQTKHYSETIKMLYLE